MNSGRFGTMIATDSPGRTPRARRRPRHAARRAVELRVGQRARPEADRDLLRPVRRRGLQDAAEIQAHGASLPGYCTREAARDEGPRVRRRGGRARARELPARGRRAGRLRRPRGDRGGAAPARPRARRALRRAAGGARGVRRRRVPRGAARRGLRRRARRGEVLRLVRRGGGSRRAPARPRRRPRRRLPERLGERRGVRRGARASSASTARASSPASCGPSRIASR